MVKCDNCDSPAVITTDNPAAEPQNFCEPCTPWFLVDRARAGMLPNPNAGAAAPVEEAAPAPKKKKAAEEATAELPTQPEPIDEP